MSKPSDRVLVERARRQVDALNATLAELADRDISAPVQVSHSFVRDDINRYRVELDSIVKTVWL